MERGFCNSVIMALNGVPHISAAGFNIHRRPVTHIYWDFDPRKEGPYKESPLVDKEGFIWTESGERVKSLWYEILLRFEKSKVLRRNLASFNGIEKVVEQSTGIKPYCRGDYGLVYFGGEEDEVDLVTVTNQTLSTQMVFNWPEIVRDYLKNEKWDLF